jgi:hypothetical protein
MNAYEGVDVYIHIFLTSGLASRLCRFTPGERAPVHIGWEVEWTPEPVWTT